MARKDKPIELKPVDQVEVNRFEEVIRLEREPGMSSKPLRLEVNSKTEAPNIRLIVPNQEHFEPRSHQPGIESLMDLEVANDLTEKNWGDSSESGNNIPWGWFVLIILGMGAALVWSLTRVTQGEAQIKQIHAEADEVVEENAREEGEASDFVGKIETCTRNFFHASTIADLLPYVRHPDRVRPLMEHYYREHPLVSTPVHRVKHLQPLTIENRGEFWAQGIELENRESRNMLIEFRGDRDVRIDWETLVCYQPMAWDAFALERPTGQSLDFRVYMQEDSFYSHEFSDSDRWVSVKLTAMSSDETLFGYFPRGDAMEADFRRALTETSDQAAAVILRLSVPEGLQSRRGVVIEKILSPRWIYLDSPESDF